MSSTTGQWSIFAVLVVLLPALGEEPASQPPEGAGAPAEPAMPSLILKLPDYGGDLWDREYMTGDWGGARTALAEKGILFELSATQVFQGNAHGGKDTNGAAAYSGSADYTLKLDSARMGLWPGGLITLRGETQFGHSINRKTGSVLSPNMDALLPVPDDSGYTTLSEFYITQALSEKLVLLAGKVDLTAGDANVFAHDEKSQFLNAGFRVNPVPFPSAPYTTMTAGTVLLPTDWLTVSTFVTDNDPDGNVTQTGFNTAFHGRPWYSVIQEYDFKIKPFGKEGHQRFGWFWTSRDLALLDQDARLQLPLTLAMRRIRPRLGLVPGPIRAAGRALRLTQNLGDVDTRPDDWGLYYNFDQYLWTEAEDETQGVGVFGRFGWSTGESNPIEQFYSIGVGGKGIIPERDRDTFGVGYYHANLSDDLPDILGVHSEQGVEVYYNIEVTPWLHITPDVQVIVNPGGGFQDRDVAVVYGLRVQTTF